MRSLHAMSRTPRLSPAAALLSLAAAGCIHAPDPAASGPLSSARRLLAREFSPAAAEASIQTLGKLPGALTRELTRPAKWRLQRATASDALRRAGGVAQRLAGGVAHELARRPALDQAIPDLHAFEQDMADDLDLSMKLLGTSLHPLAEPDDRRHRTDPSDDRPEATFWQRLRRRLRL